MADVDATLAPASYYTELAIRGRGEEEGRKEGNARDIDNFIFPNAFRPSDGGGLKLREPMRKSVGEKGEEKGRKKSRSPGSVVATLLRYWAGLTATRLG